MWVLPLICGGYGKQSLPVPNSLQFLITFSSLLKKTKQGNELGFAFS